MTRDRRSFCLFILAVFFSVVFISVALLTGWLYLSLKKSVHDEFMQSIRLDAARLEGTLKQRLVEVQLRTRDLANDNTCRVSLILGLSSELDRVIKKKIFSDSGVDYAVMDVSGRFFPTDIPNRKLTRFRGLVSQSGISSGKVNGGPRLYNVQDSLFVGFVEPIKNRSKLLGYALAIYDPSLDMVVRYDLTSSSLVTLVYQLEDSFIDWLGKKELKLNEMQQIKEGAREIFRIKDYIFVPMNQLRKVYFCAKTEELKKRQSKLFRTVVTLCSTVFFITTFVALLFWNNAKNFLRSVNEQFNLIAHDPLNRRIDLTPLRYSEFVELGRAFNLVLDSFRQTHDRLQAAMLNQLDSLGRRFETLVKSSPVGVLLLDQNNKIIYTNPAIVKMLETQTEDIVGMNFNDLPWIDKTSILDEQCAEPQEVRIKKIGSDEGIWVEVRCSSIREQEMELTVILMLDITARKIAEENKNLLIHAINQIENAVVITDLQWKILYVNHSFAELLGMKVDDIVGRSLEMARKWVISELPTIEEIERAINEEGLWSYSAAINNDKGIRFLDMAISSIRYGENGINYYVLVVKDITEHIEAERRLREKQKMEALGVLAAGIAHDFNNILTVITASVDLIDVSIAENYDSGQIEKYLWNIRNAIKRARGVIAQIFSFARRGESIQELHPVNLVSIVKEVSRLISSATPAHIEVKTRIETDSAFVLIDPSQAHQIIMNLATNSVNAMEKGGELEIGIKYSSISTEEARRLGISKGKYVVLWVKDTGIGIPREIIDRIFEPYFTTRPPGEGTGLGLSVVHSIVTRLEGAIDVQSEPGVGSTFSIYLKAAEGIDSGEHEVEYAEEKETGKSSERKIKICVVDDEKYISELIKELLARRGYDVVSFTDPIELIEFMGDHKSNGGKAEIDLLISDYSMPKCTGVEMTRQLRKNGVSVPVILMSGYPNIISEAEKNELNIAEIIAKPFSAPELLNCVEAVITEKLR